MIIVISPAKTLDLDTPPMTSTYTTPDFLDDSKKLITRMRKFDAAGLKSLMSVSDKIADLNVARFKKFKTPFTPDNAKQAALAFKGDVYTGLNIESYTKQDLTFAQKHLRILSGLYGVLRPLDLMQPYRLEMGTKVDIQKAANLYQFWDDRVTRAINKDLAKIKSDVLINLASNEYFKVIKPEVLQANIITPEFKEKKADTYKMIGLFAKKARGAMSSYIIKNRISDPADIKKFSEDGYKFNAKLSSDNKWVFTRG